MPLPFTAIHRNSPHFTATHRTKSVLSSQFLIVLNYLRFPHKIADGEVVTTFAFVA